MSDLDRFAELASSWEDGLDRGCPSCGPFIYDCDHIEGYNYALSDLRGVLSQAERDAWR